MSILHVGLYPGLSFLVSSFVEIGWKMWELWGSKFRPSHWLGTSLIQQLVAIAQAVMAMLLVSAANLLTSTSISRKRTYG